jgi:hypothetical protein
MKIQQVGKINKPLMFQSLGKYPEVQRSEKLIHTHSTRHAVVFGPTEKTKEFYHLPDQLSKITYSTENDLKELLEITKACFDREWFSTITSNADVIQGVGDAPKRATSLSDFVMYGGSKNPYLSELKEPTVKGLKPIPKEDTKAKVNIEKKVSPSVLRVGTTNDTFQTQIRSGKPPPIIPITKPKQFVDAFELGDDQDDEEGLMSVIPSGTMGLSSYVDGMDDDQGPNKEERVHGDAIDIIHQRKPKANKVNQQMSEVQKVAPSQSIAMPRMTYENTREVVSGVLPPSIDAPMPPPIDAPNPPPIDAPEPPPIDILMPPPIDAPPIDASVPPPIEMPNPPPIEISAPPIKSQPKPEAPAPSGDRGILYADCSEIPCFCEK